MKKNLRTPLLCSIVCLLGLTLSDINGQTTVHNPTFTTTNQSWYKPGTSPVQRKDYLLNGQVKGFTDQSIGSSSSLGLGAKMGLDVDLYTDVNLQNEAKVNVNFPARISYSYPADRSYGCGEEIPIATTCTVNAGYIPQFHPTGNGCSIWREGQGRHLRCGGIVFWRCGNP